MSATLPTTENNVRVHLGDLDAATYGISSERLRRIIISVAQNWTAKLPGTETTWAGGTFSVGAGSFASIETVEYNRVLGLRDDATGKNLTWVSNERMIALRNGDVIGSPDTGEPWAYTETQDAGTWIINVFPAADVGRTYAAWLAIVQPNTTTDATLLPYSAHLLSGIEHESAARAARAMKPADRQRLGITDDAVAMWATLAREILNDERLRLGRMHEPSHIPAQVY